MNLGLRVYVTSPDRITSYNVCYTKLLRSRARFDLQLSGHTHKGQIFPFRYVVERPYPYLSGLYPLGGSFLYTSRGTGTWGPPMRFLSSPVVTVRNNFV